MEFKIRQVAQAATVVPAPYHETIHDFDSELDMINELVAAIRYHAFLFANEIEADTAQHLPAAFDDICMIFQEAGVCLERSEFAFQVAHSILFPS